MALTGTDLILVNRESLTYKMPASEIIDPINAVKVTADAAKAKADANEAALANLTSTTFAVPTAGVIYTASQTVPDGFLPCDGALYSRIPILTCMQLYCILTVDLVTTLLYLIFGLVSLWVMTVLKVVVMVPISRQQTRLTSML